jgi:hypothetical protein
LRAWKSTEDLGKQWKMSVLCPPKAEVTSSNLVGRANPANDLTDLALCADTPLSAHCPRYLFDKRSEAVRRGVNAARAPPNLTKRKTPLGKAGRSRFEIIKHRTIP